MMRTRHQQILILIVTVLVISAGAVLFTVLTGDSDKSPGVSNPTPGQAPTLTPTRNPTSTDYTVTVRSTATQAESATPAQTGLTLDGVGALKNHNSTSIFLQEVINQHWRTLRNSSGFTSKRSLNIVAVTDGSRVSPNANVTDEGVKGRIERASYKSEPVPDEHVATVKFVREPLRTSDIRRGTVKKYTNRSRVYLQIPDPSNPNQSVTLGGRTIPNQFQGQKVPSPVDFARAARPATGLLQYTTPRYLGEATLNGHSVHKFVGHLNKSTVTLTEAQNITVWIKSLTYRVYVLEDPVVVRRVEYTARINRSNGLNTIQQSTFQLTQLGNVTVKQPDWTAVRATVRGTESP